MARRIGRRTARRAIIAAGTLCALGSTAAIAPAGGGGDVRLPIPAGGGRAATSVSGAELGNRTGADAVHAEHKAIDRAERRWVARRAAVVDLEPESISGVPGDAVSLHASVYDQFGQPFPGRADVHFELLAGSVHDGGERPDLGRCTTGAHASCTLTLTTRRQGADRVCAYLRDDADACDEPVEAPERADGTDIGVYRWTASPPPPPVEPADAPVPVLDPDVG